MTVKLDLKPELDARLRELAEANHLSVAQFLARLIEESVSSKRHDAIALLESWQEEDATDDPEELARRRDEWAQFRDALNEGHSSDRILFP